MRRAASVSLALLLIAYAQGSASSPQGRTTGGSLHQVTLSHLGAAGWEITDGETVLLVDPYLSRVPYDKLPGDAVITANPAIIDAHVKRADFIFLHHAHPDHILDSPYIARKTGAVVIGNESSVNILRAHGVGDDKLVPVRGGEDYQFEKFSVRVIPSLHSANSKNFIDSRVLPRNLKMPLALQDYVEGGSMSYLIRFGGHQILTFGSMNYIEREMEGLRPDVALVGAGFSRTEIFDYAGRLMRALGFPPLVVATHWDNFFVPYEASQEDAIKQKAQPFVTEIKAASPTTRVIIPKYFEPIVLEPPAKR